MSSKIAWLAGSAAALVAGGMALGVTPHASAATTAAPAVSPALAASAADRLIGAQPKLFRLAPGDQLLQANIATGGPLQYVSYLRTHNGLPVHGGDAVVVTDAAGRVLSTWAAQSDQLTVGTTPKIARSAAIRIARTRLAKVDKVDSSTLLVIAERGGRLAYEVVLTGARRDAKTKALVASHPHIFVDARTGKVIAGRGHDDIRDASGNGGMYGQVTINTSSSAGRFTMIDPSRPGVACGSQSGSPFSKSSDTWGSGSARDNESSCVDAMYGVANEWDMLKNWLGRNGIDGNGRGFPIRTGWSEVNAQWNGEFGNFGKNVAGDKQLVSMDVVGHEFGHAIFSNTPGGDSPDGWEAAGMNETTGDIFGALTEAYANNAKDRPDYEVGEMVDLDGSGPIRYMYDPSKISGDPNCYKLPYPTEEHVGAGPLNHWFYLLAEGSNPTNGQPKSPTCNGRAITGIGIQNAGKVYMGALMRKTSNWNFATVRQAAVAAAAELYGSGTECTTVKAAFDAISVPAQAGEKECSGRPTDPSTPPTTPPTTRPSSEPTTPPTTEPTPTTRPTEPPTTPSGKCVGYASHDSGDLSQGEEAYTDAFQVGSGKLTACLTGPDGSDFDLSLEQQVSGTSAWTTVARSSGPTSDELISYNARPGTYRFRIHAYDGSGNSTLDWTAPTR